MKEVAGLYNKALIFTDLVEPAALEQIERLCNQAFTIGAKIRIMPDVHAGSGSTIGTTMTVTDKLVPNLVGVDIGCGMETIRIKNKYIELEELDKLIRLKIPAGFHIRETEHKFFGQLDLTRLRCLKEGEINLSKAAKSMGTLGGGNHFIEASKDQNGAIYLVIHSGSRHIGLEVANYYQKQAAKELNQPPSEEINRLIAECKQQGKETEIQTRLYQLQKKYQLGIPKDLAYLQGPLFDDYINDMKLIQQYAVLNRKAMMDELIRGMKLEVEEQFTTIHNYLDTDRMILRKGAVSAQKGEKLLIPINMRDGSLICIGKGNPDWNYSAPHGAGRLFSRTAAKSTFTVSEFKQQMKGIYTTSVNQGTLDECPMAYKSMSDIVDNISETAEIVNIIRPIYNFKAGEE